MMKCRMIRRRVGLAPVLAAVAAVTATAGALADGWTIVTDRGPRGVERGLTEVGRVFADVLDESVGAKVAVVPAEKAPQGPGGRIFIGGSFAAKAGLMPADFRGYDYGMAEKAGDLYLFGRDCAGSRPDVPHGCVIPSALAAVRFLQEELGVLFVMPGKIGREVPKRAKLEVRPGFFRRGGVRAEYQTGRRLDVAYNLANSLYGEGAFFTYGGHTYPAACPHAKYFKTHPEYFAKNEDGSPYAGASVSCQPYCISNPGFQKLLYEEMLRRYDAGALACQLGQNDGRAGVCRCRACHDLYGTGDDWCEKLWLFHIDIAKRLRKDRPGKLVHIMCYGDTANPPKSVRVFPDNVLIEICRYGEDDMRKWDGYTVPHGFTYYIYNWSWYPVPGFTPKRSIAGLVDQVKRFHRYGMKGVYRCGYGELFGMEGPAYWVYGKLLENPDADVRAALEQYYAGTFGPAAGSMKAFYEDLEEPLAAVEKLSSTRMEDLVESTRTRSKLRDPITVLSMVYTPERVARMEAALAAAERTKGLSEKQVRRLGLVRIEWNYAKNVGTIARTYRDYEDNPSSALFETLTASLAERNRMIDWIFPEGKIRRFPDWRELNLFGNPPLAQFRTNGRLGATLEAPLLWDAESMRRYDIRPPFRMSPEARAAEIAAAGLKPLGGFAPYGGEARLTDGAFFEPNAGRTAFRFGCGTNHHVRIRRHLNAADGLLPNRLYRITWLTRWERVLSPHSYRGYYISAGNKRGVDHVECPGGSCHRGNSGGWMRECFLLKTPDEPKYGTDLKFAFWYGMTGIAEVCGVTVEDVTDRGLPSAKP